MKVQKITGMSKLQAWNAYREYRKVIGLNGNQDDKAVMEGYKALARGKTVIDLVETIKQGGFFDNEMPRLAIIRADRQTCHCKRYQYGHVRYADSQWPNSTNNNGMIELNSIFPEINQTIIAEAMVPKIPPRLRPPESSLRNYFILWEAEWRKIAPEDPMLLKPLGKNLYAVVASWNLTPIERAVLKNSKLQ